MSKNILELSAKSAKAFLLRSESYFTGDIPRYINFSPYLKKLSRFMKKNAIVHMHKEAKKISDVNYNLYINKDGKYEWRNLQIINPVIYIELINLITESNNWELLIQRVNQLKTKNIFCGSIPVIQSKNKKNIKARQILEWWENIEQASILELMHFHCLHITDIADCYPSIYTHTIPWALHGKTEAKTNWDDSLLGNQIDSIIRSMQYGQTNGIPQGSIVMDLIAELILAYADYELAQILDKQSFKYKILRYRDDYRIFTKNKQDGEIIVRELSQILLSLNLKLNSQKTISSDNILLNSIKKDKIQKIRYGIVDTNYSVQAQLLQVYYFTLENPNSNQVKKDLFKLNEIIDKNKKNSIKMSSEDVLISIVVQLAFQNPNLYPNCIQLLSTLFRGKDRQDIKAIIDNITKKFKTVPYHCLFEIWLQRIILPYFKKKSYNDKLCMIISAYINNTKSDSLWNFDWLNVNNKLKKVATAITFIDKKEIEKLPNIVADAEINIFSYYY